MKTPRFDQWSYWVEVEALRHEYHERTYNDPHKYMFRDESCDIARCPMYTWCMLVRSLLVFAVTRTVGDKELDYKFSPFSNSGKQTYGGKIWSSSGLHQLSSDLVLSESSEKNALLSEILGYRKEYC
ncbi:hypothetical protein Tco_0852427 [Tanacetum coccineum]